MMNEDDEPRQVPPRAGLCARCLHAAPVTSDRGSRFVKCLRARTDPRFAKYPALPVRACPGFEDADASPG